MKIEAVEVEKKIEIDLNYGYLGLFIFFSLNGGNNKFKSHFVVVIWVFCCCNSLLNVILIFLSTCDRKQWLAIIESIHAGL